MDNVHGPSDSVFQLKPVYFRVDKFGILFFSLKIFPKEIHNSSFFDMKCDVFYNHALMIM
jgi:hypothetical protein